MLTTEAPTELEAARERLVTHMLYGFLRDREQVAVFMKHHVFAVWDFFSLLKRLQSEVSCVEVPWRPRGLGDHARFITEIALAEECDEGVRGGHASHFELYLDAMDEIGADRGPIDAFLARLDGGADALDAIRSDDIPASVQRFVGHTLDLAINGEAHQVAASFCHGRENLLPDVLGAVRDGLAESEEETPIFHHYLDRHITLDHDEHGPLSLRLLDALCRGDDELLRDAERKGVDAIEARIELWDGVVAEIQEIVAV